MVSDTNLNAVISQGNAVTEVHNVRKNVLDSNQQFMAQHADDQQKEERSKVAQTQSGDKIEITGDERRESRDEGKQEKDERPQERVKPLEPSSMEGKLIDIKV